MNRLTDLSPRVARLVLRHLIDSNREAAKGRMSWWGTRGVFSRRLERLRMLERAAWGAMPLGDLGRYGADTRGVWLAERRLQRLRGER